MMSDDSGDKVVPFPVPDEERARRLKVEVERLARQSSTEWIYYVESPGYVEKYGVAANPTMPDGFTNRLEENYTVMLAIADMAGGDWPKRARTAAVKLSREHDEPSMGKRLLAVFYNLFVRHGSLLTSKLAEELVPIEADEFASYRNHNRPINRFEIAALLKPYGVFPSVIHPRGRPADRGYDASSFAIAFKHYLGKTLPGGRTVVRKGRGKS